MSIPKTIHYCWMSGDPYPDDIQRCIESWNEKLPEYQIKLWDKNNFDCSRWRYAEQALQRKKYAFVSDIVRLYALYTEGGMYLDSDIEVIKSFDDLLGNRAFSGIESGGRVAAWLMASEAGNPLFKELLEYYDDRSFVDDNGNMDMTPNTIPMTRIMSAYGMKPENRLQELDEITIFPEEYFCPKNPWTGKVTITENTYAMHLFAGAWNDTAKEDLAFFGNTGEYVRRFFKWMREKQCDQTYYVFGAGTVGSLVLESIAVNPIGMNGIIVTQKDNSWDEIAGFNVYQLDDIALDRNSAVIIATLPKLHKEIKRSLNEAGFTFVFGYDEYCEER